ncbi:MAG: hypothetical protein SV377_05900 [Halobacteria archaeon]|nr:hypothetical protein [Halobacteria archaeon]
MSEDSPEYNVEDLKAITGSLRYTFKISDSLLLKVYAVFFLGASIYLTILWILAMITWIGRLQGTMSATVLGFLPFLTLLYLVVIAVLLLPLYVPMRRYRNKLKADRRRKRSED